ncbi:MAG TPA: BolA family transcriptional regulator [Psychromonas hadalis]|nr:BolA family transcriptional regulator [Psychromonas hadalis]
MKTQSLIESKINHRLNPQFLEVINESGNHAVPVNSETHFKVTVVCGEFEGMRLIARHRLLNQLLSYELNGGVHALALHTFTNEQWAEKKGVIPISADCLGGGK